MSDPSAPITSLETGPIEEPITNELPLSAVRNAMRPPLPTEPVVIDGVAHARAYPGEQIEKLTVTDTTGAVVGEGLSFSAPEDDIAYGVSPDELDRIVRLQGRIEELDSALAAERRRVAELESELAYAETAKQSMRDALAGEQLALEAKDAEIARYKEAYNNQIAMHVELCKGHADEITALKNEHARYVGELTGGHQSEVKQLGLELASLRTRLASAEDSLVEGEHA